MDSDGLRPKGSVEVRCSQPGCGWAWWVDPLDSRLPDGPFDCGQNHAANGIVDRAFALLHVRHGLRWGSMRSTVPRDACDTGACGGDMTKGCAIVHRREGNDDGFIEWQSLDELRDVDALAARVLWGTADTMLPDGAPNPWPPAKQPPGTVRKLPYRVFVNGKPGTRRYAVPKKCARPGCPHDMYLDYDDPEFKPASSLWGGEQRDVITAAPEPSWWGRTVRCEDGLSQSAYMENAPCRLVHSDAIHGYEQMSNVRWTIWDDGHVIFYAPDTRQYGLLSFSNESPFESPEALKAAIHFGALDEIATRFRVTETPKCSKMPYVLSKITRQPS